MQVGRDPRPLGGEVQLIADREALADGFTGRKLERRLGSAATGRVPWFDFVGNADDDEPAVEKHDVDREAA